MRFIKSEHRRILDRLSPNERTEVIRVIDSVERDGMASAFSAWCRINSDKLMSSLKYHWRDWLKYLYVATVVVGTIALFHERGVFLHGGRFWSEWLAGYYISELRGKGLFGIFFHMVFAAIGYSLYFYVTAWAFSLVLKIMHGITSGAEDKWAKRRNILFDYLKKRDAAAEATDRTIWYGPREKADMKEFAENNPNYHSARGRAWANDI